MPPKSKRQRQSMNALAIGREKLARVMSGTSEQSASGQQDAPSVSTVDSVDAELRVPYLLSPTDALDDDDETVDPTFDLDVSAQSDTAHQLESFCENWVLQLDRDDRVSLGIFLAYNLKAHLGKGETEAAELTGLMVNRSERTIHDWQSKFVTNDFVLPDSKQVQYQRSGVLWKDQELNRRASQYIRANNVVKGTPNLTITSFCQWINEDILPNSTLCPGFPRRVSIETARCWLHELGFSVMRAQKGTFIDGHERDDVVEYRNKFIRRMVGLGFINGNNAPTEEAKRALPIGIEPQQERIDKTVISFHDESIYHVNEDQPSFWGDCNTRVLKPKSKGAGIMVSDFVDECEGYLAMTREQYDQAKLTDPHFPFQARQTVEYGDSKEGYWTSARFMQQMERAVRIADFKYPKSDGWRCVWIFDHSSCHTCVAEDALDVNYMNVHPGGKQRVMCDGFWDGKVQSMNRNGIPKGMKQVLEERGVDTRGMTAARMKEILGSHPDFKDQKSKVEVFLNSKGHLAYFLPKFHCELNPIERVWGQSKRYTKAYSKYTIQSLRVNIPHGLDSVTVENICNYFKKAREYMFAYLEGVPVGSDLESRVKMYKKSITSHRRVSDIQ